MSPALAVAAALAAHALTHLWLSASRHEIDAGDAAAIGDPGRDPGWAGSIEDRIGRADVSRTNAEAAASAGLCGHRAAASTRPASYSRRHDPTALADAPWLAAYLAPAAALAAAGAGADGLLAAMALCSAAHADWRQRLIPVPAILALALAAAWGSVLEANPAPVLLAGAALVAAAALRLVAWRSGGAFGGGDLVLVPLSVSALDGPGSLAVMAAAMVPCLAAYALLEYTRAGRIPARVPLAAIVAPAAVAALILEVIR